MGVVTIIPDLHDRVVQMPSGLWDPGYGHSKRSKVKEGDTSLAFNKVEKQVVSGKVIQVRGADTAHIHATRDEAIASGLPFHGDGWIVSVEVPCEMPEPGDTVWLSNGAWGCAEESGMTAWLAVNGVRETVGTIDSASISFFVKPGGEVRVFGPKILCETVPTSGNLPNGVKVKETVDFLRIARFVGNMHGLSAPKPGDLYVCLDGRPANQQTPFSRLGWAMGSRIGVASILCDAPSIEEVQIQRDHVARHNNLAKTGIVMDSRKPTDFMSPSEQASEEYLAEYMRREQKKFKKRIGRWTR